MEARRRVAQGTGDHRDLIDSTFGTPLDLNLIGLQTLYLKESGAFSRCRARPWQHQWSPP